MSYRNQKIIVYIVVALIVVLGMLLGTLFDLDISKALSFEQIGIDTYVINSHWFFDVFNVLGIWLISLFISVCCIILAINVLRRIEIKSAKIIIPLLLVIFEIAILAYASVLTMKTFAPKLDFWHYLVSVVITIVLSILMFLTIAPMPKSKLSKMIYPCLTTLICSFILFIIVLVLSFVIGRLSPSELVKTENIYESYKVWYIFTPSLKYSSCPSNLIAMITFMFSSTIFFKEKSGPSHVIFNIVFVILTTLFSLSLLFSGKSYLSDIAFGFCLGFVFSELNKLFYKKLTSN